MCCMRLAENTGGQKLPKIRHLSTITQLCRAISSQLRHISTSRKKHVKQQHLSHMSSQYDELRPTSGWGLFISLGHPSNFQWVSPLGSVTTRRSSSGRQPKFAALNTGCHLHSEGQPSGWALAHILVFFESPTTTATATFVLRPFFPGQPG